MKGLMTMISIFPATVMVGGCDSGTKWRSGSYEVYWVDKSPDLALGLRVKNAALLGRVMPQVIAVGENARWMVAARHPRGDKTKTEYFYFSKMDDRPEMNADEIVKGPFDEIAFMRNSNELGLPPLTKHF